MKILVPILSFGKEGGYKVLSKLANEIVMKGHEVTFLVPYVSPAPYYPTTATITWINKGGRLSATNNCKAIKTSLWRSVYLLWLGLKAVDNSYDVVLANHSLTVFPILYSGIRGKKFYYIQAYEPIYYKELPGLKNRVLEWVSRKTYSVPFRKIVNSNIYRNYQEIAASDVVFPGLDFNAYYPKPDVALPKNRIRIGTIARRERHKGTHTVLEAFHKIFEKRTDVELHLAFADSSLEDRGRNIFVCNPHGEDELSAYYRSLDVYFCGVVGQHGAIHYPVIETMASGTTLVTTDYYPATSSNAYLVEPANPDAMVQAFELLMENEELRLKKLKQALIDVQQFSWHRISEKMLAILGRGASLSD